MAHFGPTRRSLLQGTLASGALSLTGFPGAGRTAVEENICRHQAGSDPGQGSTRRQPAEIHQGVHRTDRDRGRVGADSRRAAAAEMRDRTRVRQAELRCRSCQLSRAEAPVREGGLARRHVRLHEGSEPHHARSRRYRFLRGRAAICQERQGRDALRCRGRSTISSSITTRSCSRRKASRCRRRWTRWWRPPKNSPIPRKAPSVSSAAVCAMPTWRCGPISTSTMAANSSTPRAIS